LHPRRWNGPCIGFWGLGHRLLEPGDGRPFLRVCMLPERPSREREVGLVAQSRPSSSHGRELLKSWGLVAQTIFCGIPDLHICVRWEGFVGKLSFLRAKYFTNPGRSVGSVLARRWLLCYALWTIALFDDWGYLNDCILGARVRANKVDILVLSLDRLRYFENFRNRRNTKNLFSHLIPKFVQKQCFRASSPVFGRQQ
jgi:hypothetical protein